MKKQSLATMLLAAAAFIVFGTLPLAANGKCGAGKCGGSAPVKCGSAAKSAQSSSAATWGKNGHEKDTPRPKGKCGAGKCG